MIRCGANSVKNTHVPASFTRQLRLPWVVVLGALASARAPLVIAPLTLVLVPLLTLVWTPTLPPVEGGPHPMRVLVYTGDCHHSVSECKWAAGSTHRAPRAEEQLVP